MRILLLLAKGFETMEASVFVDVMGWADQDYHCQTKVVTCGMQRTVRSAFGIPVQTDILIGEADPDGYDALAIPGGFEEYGFYEEAFSPAVSELIRQFHDRKKPIASVCVGALALAHSGILTGKKATTYHLNGGVRQKQLAAYGVEIVNKPVVITENLITSYCPQTAPEVAFCLLEMLAGTEKMQTVKTAMGFGC